MVDCGFSLRQTELRLEQLGTKAMNLDAILVTHEHSDHSKGVAALSRKYQIPVYLTHGTLASGRLDDCSDNCLFATDKSFAIKDLEVQPVAVPHDAREPSQFVMHSAGSSLGILTDLGKVTSWVEQCYAQCDALVLEFNHDTDLLWQGNYPPALKRRVAGDWGHLNNNQAAALLERVDQAKLQHLVVAHVSEANNETDKVAESLTRVLGGLESVVWATQATGYNWLQIDPR